MFFRKFQLQNREKTKTDRHAVSTAPDWLLPLSPFALPAKAFYSPFGGDGALGGLNAGHACLEDFGAAQRASGDNRPHGGRSTHHA
jgi:hypothetical protein